MNQQQLILIKTTCDKREPLELLAQKLVSDKLAACCQIGGPITSVYTWQGKTETSDEWFCEIKTKPELVSQVTDTIQVHHPYETPEIIALGINVLNEEYLKWAIDCMLESPAKMSRIVPRNIKTTGESQSPGESQS